MNQYLRTLPTFTDLKQRLTLEAIGAAAAIVDLELGEMTAIAAAAIRPVGPPDFEDRQRLAFFRSAWSIVDRIHAIKQLIASDPRLQIAAEHPFMEHARAAHVIRNRMDHLQSNFGNLAGKKSSYPLYGLISFAYSTPVDEIEIAGTRHLTGHSIAVVWAMSSHKKWSVEESKCAYAAPPSGAGLRLHACGRFLDLSEAGAALRRLVETLETAAEESLREQAPEPEAMRRRAAGADAMVLRQTFGAPCPLHAGSLRAGL